MRTSVQRAGDEAESRVAQWLAAMGWSILGRNVRLGRLELDIVAIDPGPRASLVIVEVRWRRRRDFGLPEETVDYAKRARLRAGVGALRDRDALPDGTPLPRLPLRIDLVSVEPGGVLRHHRHVA